MDGKIGQPHVGQAALARAQQFAGPAQPKILLGNPESVLGFAHDREPRLGGLAERHGIQQQAARLAGTATDAAPELVKLRQAEALGVLDDHDRGRRHVDTDFDDGRGHQDRESTVGKGRHGRFALRTLEAAVQQADLAGKARTQELEALLDIGQVDFLRFLDQRTHPVDPCARADHAADALDDLGEALEGDRARVDRQAAGGLLRELGNIEVAVRRQHEGAGYGRRGHDQEVHRLALR